MRVFVIVALLGICGLIALAVLGASTSIEEADLDGRKQAFIKLFQDNIEEGKQDFFFIGTHCMTVEADLDLPEYFTNHYNELAVTPIIFSVENGIQTADDPAFKAFTDGLSTEFEAKTKRLNERYAQESDVMKEAMSRVVAYVNETDLGLYKCIGDRLIEEQSPSVPTGN